ncbi:MAG: DUF5719 family protein [Actinomycetota bacterium]
MMGRRSTLAVAIAAMVVVAGGITLERVLPGPASPRAASAAVAYSGTWYCAAGRVAEGYDEWLMFSNPGSTPTHAHVDYMGEKGVVGTQDADVPAGRRVALHVAGSLPSGPVSASVHFSGGALVVERAVYSGREAGNLGVYAGLCADRPSRVWYVTGGTTYRGDDFVLTLMNPFESDAVAKVIVLTSEGQVEPRRLQSVYIPPKSRVSLLLNESAPDLGQATAVVQARSGRLVVEGTLARSGSEGRPKGITLLPSSHRLLRQFAFSAGQTPNNSGQWLEMANPSTESVAVDLRFQTDSEQFTPSGLEEITVPAESVVEISLVERFPDHPAFGVVVDTQGGKGLSSALMSYRPTSAGGELATQAPQGVASGETSVGPASWAVVEGGASDEFKTKLTLLNPGSEPALAGVRLLGEQAEASPAALAAIQVPAGRQITVDLNAGAPFQWFSILVKVSAGRLVVGAEIARSMPYGQNAWELIAAYPLSGSADPRAGVPLVQDVGASSP